MSGHPENCILEPRGRVAYGLAPAYRSVLALRVGNMRTITFLFVDQSLSRRLEKFGEDIPTIHHGSSMILVPNFVSTFLLLARYVPKVAKRSI